MLEQVRVVISDFIKIPLSRVEPGTKLMDVVAESFQLVELMLVLQEDFEISLAHDDMNSVVSIEDLSKLIEKKCQAAA